MPSPLRAIRQTGSVDASALSTIGGRVPGGRRRCSAAARLASVETGVSAFVPGWKNTLMTATPGSDARLHVLDARREREETFLPRHDVVFHLLGRHPG